MRTAREAGTHGNPTHLSERSVGRGPRAGRGPRLPSRRAAPRPTPEESDSEPRFADAAAPGTGAAAARGRHRAARRAGRRRRRPATPPAPAIPRSGERPAPARVAARAPGASIRRTPPGTAAPPRSRRMIKAAGGEVVGGPDHASRGHRSRARPGPRRALRRRLRLEPVCREQAVHDLRRAGLSPAPARRQRHHVGPALVLGEVRPRLRVGQGRQDARPLRQRLLDRRRRRLPRSLLDPLHVARRRRGRGLLVPLVSAEPRLWPRHGCRPLALAERRPLAPRPGGAGAQHRQQQATAPSASGTTSRSPARPPSSRRTSRTTIARATRTSASTRSSSPPSTAATIARGRRRRTRTPPSPTSSCAGDVPLSGEQVAKLQPGNVVLDRRRRLELDVVVGSLVGRGRDRGETGSSARRPSGRPARTPCTSIV